jgi:hypothetical protein
MDFFALTSDQVHQGIAIMYDSVYQNQATIDNDPLLAFAFDVRLQKLATLWVECDEDMLLTKLKCDF